MVMVKETPEHNYTSHLSWRDQHQSWRVPPLQFRIFQETFTSRCPRAITKHAEEMKDQTSSLKWQRLLHGQAGLSLDTQLLFPPTRLPERTSYRITEPQNYLSWKGLKIIPRAGTPSTRPGYSKPLLTQPWTLPGIGHPQLPGQPGPSVSPNSL